MVPDSSTAAGNVLLVRFGSLGDVVLATTAATRVREALPGAVVGFVTKADWAPVLYHHPDLRKIIAFEPGGREGLPQLAARLRRERWDTVIDLHGNLRSRLLVALLRPHRRARYSSGGAARRLLVHAPRLARGLGIAGRNFQVTGAYAAAVDACLGPGASAVPHPRVHLAPVEAEWAGREMERIGVTPGCVGICPGARHATKRWPVEYYAETVDRLAVREDARVPVFLSSSTADGGVEAALRRAVRRPEALCIVRQPIRRVAALLARCRTVITNDSGLMHLAAAVGTPVVALFGPTVTEFGFSPAGEGHQVLERPMSCRPCSLHGGPACPRKHFRCLREIPPEEVLLALERINHRTPRV